MSASASSIRYRRGKSGLLLRFDRPDEIHLVKVRVGMKMTGRREGPTWNHYFFHISTSPSPLPSILFPPIARGIDGAI